jgi:hypothetical protein
MTALFLFETSATILQSTGLTSRTSVSKAPLRLPQIWNLLPHIESSHIIQCCNGPCLPEVVSVVLLRLKCVKLILSTVK